MDGALEFDEHGRESNSNKAKTGFDNRLAPATGDDFLWVLSLFVQRKYLALSESENTPFKKESTHLSGAKEHYI